MQPQGRRRASWLVSLVPIPALCLLAGCASPGAPRPPSLQLPEPVRNLVALRSGETVELQFTAPTRTTDGLPLRSPNLEVRVCRQGSPGEPCRPVSVAELRALPAGNAALVGVGSAVSLEDTLPDDLRGGPPRALRYRVELRNGDGRSAGLSEPAFVAAGAAPAPVTELSAEGTRNGVLLQWRPVPQGGEVLLGRRQLDPVPGTGPGKHPSPRAPGTAVPALGKSGKRTAREPDEPGLTWLQADPGNASAARGMDTTPAEGVRYGYTAVRRRLVPLGGRTLELRSAPSAPVEVIWRDDHPPVAPQGLTAIGFSTPGIPMGAGRTYAVDLVWEPVADSRVSGYVVRRIALGTAVGLSVPAERLNAAPVVAPAFHDTTALASESYRYEVTAVDAKGNTSAPATAVVKAAQP